MWLASHGSDDLLQVTKQDLRLWIADGQRRWKPNTVRCRFICFQAFYRWALEEDEIPVNPTVGISVARGHEPAPDVLSPEEITALLKACEGPGHRERRDFAVFRLMLATGLRVSEAASLRAGDLDLLARVAVIREGKGGKPRAVRFDAPTAAALDRYKRVRARHRFASLPNLWIGERGRWTNKGIAQALEVRSAKAGIGHVYPHQLRHTFAHRFLDGGGEEGDLMVLGGWESSAVMRRYGAARAADRALAGYDATDPMRGL